MRRYPNGRAGSHTKCLPNEQSGKAGVDGKPDCGQPDARTRSRSGNRASYRFILGPADERHDHGRGRRGAECYCQCGYQEFGINRVTGTQTYSFSRVTPSNVGQIERAVPVETAIAIEYNGFGYAVMMATPTDLEDFATGFSLSEQIIGNISQIDSIEVVEVENGTLLKIWIDPALIDPVLERARTRVSESGCGLCGMESLDRISAPLETFPQTIAPRTEAVFAALESLGEHQPLNRATGGMHAAAFCDPDGAIQICREDVGRHNALDKTIGALSRGGFDPGSGFFLLSSRCSYELVEKSVRARCPALVTISTATSLAIMRARAANLNLTVLARSDAILMI